VKLMERLEGAVKPVKWLALPLMTIVFLVSWYFDALWFFSYVLAVEFMGGMLWGWLRRRHTGIFAGLRHKQAVSRDGVRFTLTAFLAGAAWVGRAPSPRLKVAPRIELCFAGAAAGHAPEQLSAWLDDRAVPGWFFVPADNGVDLIAWRRQVVGPVPGDGAASWTRRLALPDDKARQQSELDQLVAVIAALQTHRTPGALLRASAASPLPVLRLGAAERGASELLPGILEDPSANWWVADAALRELKRSADDDSEAHRSLIARWLASSEPRLLYAGLLLSDSTPTPQALAVAERLVADAEPDALELDQVEALMQAVRLLSERGGAEDVSNLMALKDKRLTKKHPRLINAARGAARTIQARLTEEATGTLTLAEVGDTAGALSVAKAEAGALSTLKDGG